MNSFHDPIRQINYLKQTFSQDKKPLGFFISAGCPLSIKINGIPLIPDIRGMTEEICSRMTANDSEYKSQFNNILSHLKEDGKPQPNLEEILSHIRALKQVVGNGEVRGFNETDLNELDDQICKIIVEISSKRLPNSDTPYHKIAAWITAIERDHPIEIFTTNYDLLFEQALEDNRTPYFDGFVGSRQTFFDLRSIEEDLLPSRWTRLWKLHGSINWLRNENGEVFRGISGDSKHSFLIHPSHLKYDESRRMPYLAMIDRLRAFLRQASSALFICGYSFSDDHLNEVLFQGLQGNSTAIIFAFLYGNLENYSKATSLAMNRANLTLLAFDQGIIGTKRGHWIVRDNLDEEYIPTDIIKFDKDKVEKKLNESSNEKTRDGNPSNRITKKLKDADQKNEPEEEMEEDIQQASFELGDFAKLGLFLQDLIGEGKNVGQ